MGQAYLEGYQRSYVPVAVYYEEADRLEYVRTDEPTVYRRIDDLLTLILAMNTREPLGFQLKGFRHFYQQHLRQKVESGDESFSKLIFILEEATKLLGDKIFSESGLREAYLKARDIAEEDSVEISSTWQVA